MTVALEADGVEDGFAGAADGEVGVAAKCLGGVCLRVGDTGGDRLTPSRLLGIFVSMDLAVAFRAVVAASLVLVVGGCGSSGSSGPSGGPVVAGTGGARDSSGGGRPMAVAERLCGRLNARLAASEPPSRTLVQKLESLAHAWMVGDQGTVKAFAVSKQRDHDGMYRLPRAAGFNACARVGPAT
jgi:hypothetical protein